VTSRTPPADDLLDAALRNAADGAVDAVRRRARFDVSRWIAGASGLRRIVELARSETTPVAAHPATGRG
jgi:hypothetical protein